MLHVLIALSVVADALSKPGSLDWASVGPTIGLRFTGVRPIGTKESASAIEGGELVDQGLPVDGVMSQTPQRGVSLFFPEGAVRGPDIATRQYGADQRMIPSRSAAAMQSFSRLAPPNAQFSSTTKRILSSASPPARRNSPKRARG